MNPTLIVEVLSPSTELYDRKGKTDLDRAIPSVEAIVLIASDEPRVERYRRHGELWTYVTVRGIEATVDVLEASGAPQRPVSLYPVPTRPDLGRGE